MATKVMGKDLPPPKVLLDLMQTMQKTAEMVQTSSSAVDSVADRMDKILDLYDKMPLEERVARWRVGKMNRVQAKMDRLSKQTSQLRAVRMRYDRRAQRRHRDGDVVGVIKVMNMQHKHVVMQAEEIVRSAKQLNTSLHCACGVPAG